MLTGFAGGQEATPDNASVQVNETVTSVLFQPAALGEGEPEAVIEGGVSSILTVAVVVLVFPATSVLLPVASCPLPSLVNANGEAQVATPESVSAQVKLTVTLVLFQPNDVGWGVSVAVIEGGVLSILSVTAVLALLPALSVAVPEIL